MSQRRVGLWLIGAVGGVSSTAVLGLSALSRKLTDTTSLVTATPLFDGVELDDFAIPGVGHEARGVERCAASYPGETELNR